MFFLFTGALKHNISEQPEVGGLVCRMPLEAELNNPSSILYKRLQSFLESDKYRSNRDKSSDSLSPLAAKTAFWYRGAEQLLKNDLEDISMMANENGKIEVEKLGRTSLELLQLYIDYQVSMIGYVIFPWLISSYQRSFLHLIDFALNTTRTLSVANMATCVPCRGKGWIDGNC